MSNAGHLVLLGDSIFDNGAYVGRQQPVLEQVRDGLPGWRVSLGAVDGASSGDIADQLTRLDGSETHFFVSAGGNDALNASGMLGWAVATVADAQDVIAQAQAKFRDEYERMAGEVLALGRPAVFCTVYDAIPGLGDAAMTALTAFNDVILRTAFRNRVPVLDLRLVCDVGADYSAVSSIEPSSLGGAKIAKAIVTIAREHDFSIRRTVVFP